MIAGVVEGKYYGDNEEINGAISSFIGMNEKKFSLIIREHDLKYGGFYELTEKELMHEGFSVKQADRLIKLMKLSMGLFRKIKVDDLRIRSPSSVAACYMHMKYNRVEEMKIICVDTKYQVLYEETLSVGTVNASLVNPREVYISALKHNASSILLLHNHPSGNPEPSPEDIAVTKRIKSVGELIGINLLDHIIIGDGCYCSLKEKGYV